MKTEQEIKNIANALIISLNTLKAYNLSNEIKRTEGALIILDYVLGIKEAEQCEACLLDAKINLPKNTISQK